MDKLESIERVKAIIDPNDELELMESPSGDVYFINSAGEPRYRFVGRQ